MTTPACPTDVGPHPLLVRRSSPRRFDRDADVAVGQIDALLDAGRLAPSAGNSQPWSFIVGRRGDAVHGRIVRHLTASSLRWAVDASVLIMNLAHTRVEGAEQWEYSEFARYDLGQAVAHMTVQGLTMGLAARQFRAFDRDAMTNEFEVLSHWEITSATAFGISAEPATEASEPGTGRERLSRDDVTWVRSLA